MRLTRTQISEPFTRTRGLQQAEVRQIHVTTKNGRIIIQVNNTGGEIAVT